MKELRETPNWRSWVFPGFTHTLRIEKKLGQNQTVETGRHLPTYTRRRVRLPVEPVVHLNTCDGVLALQLVSWVTLERHTVTRLFAVPVARAIYWDAGVIAGGCCGS